MARQTLPQNYQIRSGTLLESFQTIGDWTLGGTAGGAQSVDSTIYSEGTGSLKLTSDVSASSNVFSTKTISVVLNGVISFDVYIPDPILITSAAVYISSTTNFSKFFLATVTGLTIGWNRIRIHKNFWSNTGSEDWANTMVRLRVRVNSSASGSGVAYFDNLVYGTYHRPKVVLIMDDGFSSQYTEAFAYMNPKGLKATCAIVGNFIDTTNYMTSAQIQTMYDAGWDMSNHTIDHTNLTTLGTQAEIEAKISANTDFLVARGFTRNNCHKMFVYPNGGYNSTVLSAVSAQGMLAARTTITQSGISVATPSIDYRTLVTRNLGNTTTLSSVLADIDNAIAAGATLILEAHKFIPSPTASTEFLDTDFRLMIDYIYKYVLGGVLDMVTFSEWYQCLASPRQVGNRNTSGTRSASSTRTATS